MVNTIQENCEEDGEVVFRHMIGVLEVIKSVDRPDPEETFNEGNQCQCPDMNNMFSELELIKLSKIASTTSVLLSSCNLFSNLERKVNGNWNQIPYNTRVKAFALFHHPQQLKFVQ